MDYLQYRWDLYLWQPDYKDKSFKPYYKWITFNTAKLDTIGICFPIVLNLIINGLPSIQFLFTRYDGAKLTCFKPYYKWITFNTKTYLSGKLLTYSALVLNLIINGLPSIQNSENLVNRVSLQSFKPYYKWITFNTSINTSFIIGNS